MSRKLEHELLSAQINGDRKALDRLLHEKYVGVDSDGTVVGKRREIDEMCARPPSSAKFEQLLTRSVGDTTVVTGILTMEGANSTAKFRFVDTFADSRLLATVVQRFS